MATLTGSEAAAGEALIDWLPCRRTEELQRRPHHRREKHVPPRDVPARQARRDAARGRHRDVSAGDIRLYATISLAS